MHSKAIQLAVALTLFAAQIKAQLSVNASAPTNEFVIVEACQLNSFFSINTIIDKTEGNGNADMQINGHPAWGARYNIETNSATPMDLVSNSFCAGGNVLGDGRWLNVGGNQGVLWGGLPTANTNQNPYDDADGGKAIRIYTPCDPSTGATCDWEDDITGMTTRRWYPTLETLSDGSMIIIGGCDYGGYVNDAGQNNPTFEYYPSQGSPIGLNILANSLPANLFVVTYLLPSGLLFINSNLNNELFDMSTNTEYALPNTPHSVRTYPGSAATAMYPLTPQNNWTATVIFCGGTNLQPDQWTLNWNIAAYPADSSCISITPDVSPNFVDEDPLPEGRSMGEFISLPDGRFLLLNGVGLGTAGYGNTSWAIGQAFGTDPVFQPAYYDPALSTGKRFYRTNLGNATVPRLYHSSATLLPDGSVASMGSNPNADYIAADHPGYKWPTEYRVEYFYPDYYHETRPQPQGLPQTLSYGGNSFDLTLSSADLGGDSSALSVTKVVVIRPGFSTHAINFGQRYVQLNNTASWDSATSTATLHVSQMPPNANILAPGPAMIFVVVDGVPSIGQWLMVGSGQIGQQTISAAADLPASSGFAARAGDSTNGQGSVAAKTSSALLAFPDQFLALCAFTLATFIAHL